jgi:hypothetical protein
MSCGVDTGSRNAALVPFACLSPNLARAAARRSVAHRGAPVLKSSRVIQARCGSARLEGVVGIVVPTRVVGKAIKIVDADLDPARPTQTRPWHPHSVVVECIVDSCGDMRPTASEPRGMDFDRTVFVRFQVDVGVALWPPRGRETNLVRTVVVAKRTETCLDSDRPSAVTNPRLFDIRPWIVDHLWFFVSFPGPEPNVSNLVVQDDACACGSRRRCSSLQRAPGR